ncbi:hypothetical protein M409DRAFT_25975 [Zasmidium cellare ATCC 36951]|uniref:Uncharacterized protein n=1 Tax=Zasmidium cellare ATCC 36951 TaxID=1080233 RepID=A0A6A6C9H5_ZASCE|nr:uncharacterized protein M409DRAFT_25975 [Zasmidium cellare ATCC 36951]KAF2163794.1 hypothetical protein M409DRAFT_25975 [Zasmidium cellare ATCC 36951]
MCFSCFTSKGKKSADQNHQQSPAIPLTDQANRSTRSNARPSTRRGNHQAAQPPHTNRQPTVTAIPPDLEQETDLASSSAFAGTTPPRPMRHQPGRKVSRMEPPSIQESAPGPNVTTFPEKAEAPSPLRGDLRTLPSVRRSENREKERQDGQPGHSSANSGPLASKMSWSTSSGEGGPASAASPQAGASSSSAQASQVEPLSHFSDTSSSGEEEADAATLRPLSAVTQVGPRTGLGGSGSSFRSNSSSD